MSRGPGYLQRWLLENIAGSDKAMMFNEILVAAYPEDYGIPGRSVERSLRRALRGLIGDSKMGAVIALGEGGPADPHRYAYNPIWAALAGNEEDYQRLCAIAQAGRNSIAAR
jgi:hypothetical protein